MRNYTLKGPTTISIEASLDAILEAKLDTFEGEHFQTIENVVSIIDDGDTTAIETCRTIEAWRRGEPNAGRFTMTIPNKYLEKIHFPGDNDNKEQH